MCILNVIYEYSIKTKFKNVFIGIRNYVSYDKIFSTIESKTISVIDRYDYFTLSFRFSFGPRNKRQKAEIRCKSYELKFYIFDSRQIAHTSKGSTLQRAFHN